MRHYQCLVLLLPLLVSLASCQSTLYVATAPNTIVAGAYATLDEALLAATPGTTILVAPNVRLAQPQTCLSSTGGNATQPLLVAGPYVVDTPNVVIRGLCSDGDDPTLQTVFVMTQQLGCQFFDIRATNVTIQDLTLLCGTPSALNTTITTNSTAQQQPAIVLNGADSDSVALTLVNVDISHPFVAAGVTNTPLDVSLSLTEGTRLYGMEALAAIVLFNVTGSLSVSSDSTVDSAQYVALLASSGNMTVVGTTNTLDISELIDWNGLETSSAANANCNINTCGDTSTAAAVYVALGVISAALIVAIVIVLINCGAHTRGQVQTYFAAKKSD